MSPVRHFTIKVKRRMSNGVRVLVVTGASGGHIFPALSFLDALKDKAKKIETLLVIPSSSIKSQILLEGYKVRYLSISPIKLRLSLSDLIAIFRFLKGSLESLILLIEFRPDIVVGFGSLDSVPLLLFAWLFRIKTLIHEQNVIPGKANRLLAKFVDRIAISFFETKDYFKKSIQQRLTLTGNPIRKQLKRIDKEQALSFFGFEADKFTILVMGGSLGSSRINTCFLKAISKITDKSRFQVIHLTGIKDYDLSNKSYKDLNLEVKLFTFLKDMQYAYSASDLVICRAGATTIAELINFSSPAIIIPYPFAYKHQLSNAKVLEEKGSAIIISDNELNPDSLRQTIQSLVDNPAQLEAMHLAYNGLLESSRESLVNAVLSLQFS